MSRNDSYSFQQFQTNGISVRAVVEGTGPLVIMVHGFPELWYSWRHQIQPIAEAGFKVVDRTSAAMVAATSRIPSKLTTWSP